MTLKPYIVGLGGTTRPNSSSERLTKAVLNAVEERGAETQLFDGAYLASLPHYAPENPERILAQTTLVAALRRADGIIIGSPSYHGSISGLVKNALDQVEDMRKDARVYFDGLPVGLIVTSAGWQGGGITLSAMRDMVHALRGWPTPVGITVNSIEQAVFAPDGTILDAAVLKAIHAQADQLLAFSRQKAPALTELAS